MTDEEKKAENLRKAAELFTQDHVTPEDLGGVLKKIYTHLSDKVEGFFTDTTKKIEDFRSNNATELERIESRVDDAHGAISRHTDQFQRALDEIQLTPGEPGRDADEQKIIEAVLAKIPTPKNGEDGDHGSPDTPEQVWEKVMLMLEEHGLEAKYVKNLPKQANKPFMGGATALHALSDVDVSGILDGQSIKYNAAGGHWVIYTPAGALTVVYGEAPTDSGDHTSFTLAHTPAAGHLRVYRGGSRLSATATNYTLVGATLTLANALAVDGGGNVIEELYVDYDY